MQTLTATELPNNSGLYSIGNDFPVLQGIDNVIRTAKSIGYGKLVIVTNADVTVVINI